MSKKTKTQRQATVDALQADMKASPNLYLTDFTGLDVGQLTDLRQRLRNAGVRYLVVKNTLVQRAMAANDVTAMDDYLRGPTGLVLAGDEPVAAAKVLTDFVKEFERPEIKAGLLDGQPVSPDEVKRLAMLPSREQLLAQVAGTLQAPLAGFVGALSGMLYQFAGAVEALRAQRSADSQ